MQKIKNKKRRKKYYMKQIRPYKDTIAKDFNRHQNGPRNGSVSSHWSEYEPTNSIRRNSPLVGEERRSGKRDRKKSSPSIDMASKAYCNLCVNINNPSTYQKFLLLFPRHSPASSNHHLCYLLGLVQVFSSRPPL